MTAPAALTAFDTEFRSRLASGLVVSVLVHLGVGIALIGRSTEIAGKVAITDALSPPEPEIPRVRPGISESRAVTINWLGFESPTEHQAAPAETEQAALSPLQPGAPDVIDPVALSPVQPGASEVAAATPPEESLAQEPSSESSTTPGSTPAAPSPALSADLSEAPVSEPGESIEPILPAAEAVVDEAGALASQLVQIVKRTIAEVSESQVSETEASETEVSEAQGAALPPGDQPRDAEASEKEATATSLDPVRWSPGHPIAAEGLDITPVHPRWNISTRLSAMPRNPVVRLDFGKDGRVKKAAFLEGKSTGYRDVDGPLLDAVYRWTAKGEVLEKLPQGDAEATVSIPIEIVLVRARGPIERSSAGR